MSRNIRNIRKTMAGIAGGCLLLQSNALAAGIESSFNESWQMGGRIFNFLLLLAILIYFLRKPILQFFAGRTEGIRQKIAEAEAAHNEARIQLEQIQKRLQNLDDEVASLVQKAEADAETEKARIEEQTAAEAEQRRARSRQEIESLKNQALSELRQFTADRVVNMAEDLIKKRMNPEDQERLFETFLEKMGENR